MSENIPTSPAPAPKSEALLGFNAGSSQADKPEGKTEQRFIDYNGEKLEVPEAFWTG
jgi:hypothetical protein